MERACSVFRTSWIAFSRQTIAKSYIYCPLKAPSSRGRKTPIKGVCVLKMEQAALWPDGVAVARHVRAGEIVMKISESLSRTADV
jgi:hypothetical protein